VNKIAKRPSTKKPAAIVAENHSFFKVGTCYLIRAVTNYFTGRLVGITDGELLLEDAAWIADIGRFHDALKGGNLNEIEPYPLRVIVARGAIIEATEWPHPLPREQK
jgi:hypothetical protein